MARTFWIDQDHDKVFARHMSECYQYLQDVVQQNGIKCAGKGRAPFAIQWVDNQMIDRILRQLREDGYQVWAESTRADDPSFQFCGQTASFLKNLHNVTFWIDW